MKKIIYILPIIFLPLFVKAQAAPSSVLDSLACFSTNENCQLGDVVQGFILLIRLLLGYMGAVALLFFVIGGFKWLTSRGNPESVRNGQRIMTNTVIALAIAFTSYLLLSFFVNNILGVKTDSGRIGGAAGECESKSDGTACQVVAGQEVNPYECYNGKCETKCYVKSKNNPVQGMPSFISWECHDVPDLSALPATTEYYEKNLCPGDEHNVCLMMNPLDGLPMIPSIP